jgi:hypothetical protein
MLALYVNFLSLQNKDGRQYCILLAIGKGCCLQERTGKLSLNTWGVNQAWEELLNCIRLLEVLDDWGGWGKMSSSVGTKADRRWESTMLTPLQL